MRIILAADHGGFAQKEVLAAHLRSVGHDIVDCGAFVHEPTDDYLTFADAAVAAYAHGSIGFLLCRTGEGMAAAVNKHHGIVAGTAWNPEIARLAREHNHAEFLALPADHLSSEELQACAHAFIDASPSTAERHVRRSAELHQR